MLCTPFAKKPKQQQQQPAHYAMADKKDYKCHFRVSFTQNIAKKTASHVFIFENLMNAVLTQEEVETKPSQQSCLYITL